MKFTIQFGQFENKNKSDDCLILGVYEENHLSPSAERIDKTSNGFLRKILKKGDFNGKSGEFLLLHDVPHISAGRVLLIGCGKQKSTSQREYRKAISTAIRALSNSKTQRVYFFLTDLEVENYDLPWKIKHLVEVCNETLYVFNEFKSKKEPKRPLHEIIIVSNARKTAACETALAQALAISIGTEFTKNLANMPSNICTPSYVAEQAQRLAKEYKNIKLKVLEEKDLAKLGMNTILAVAQGSLNEAHLVCLEYHGANKKEAPIAFVGKGITFDTGGISIKPADAMVGMKYDMCGAATVLGVFMAAAELKLPVNLVGILALAENMPGGTAIKPEDIVTTMSGQTVEILNTDAEGRLVLCDALTYCERFKPKAVIDIATLTGAVVIALGHHATGLLANNQQLADDLLAAGQTSFDRAWQMPLWEEFQDQLKSPFADMSNTGGRTGGTITAACFLSRFAKTFNWAHLDVAGTAAMMTGGDRYATGRPVPMLVQYLINQCEQA